MENKEENLSDKDALITQNSAKSEEVQAIIDRMPTQWAKYVTLLTGLLMAVIILLGFIIKYPDTVDGQISITAPVAPVRLVANASSRIYLLKENKSMLKKGDVIAYLESGTDYTHVLLLDSLLKVMSFEEGSMLSVPGNLILGDIGPAYNSFSVVYAQYERLLMSDIYETMRRNLQNQITSDKNVIMNFDRELALKEQVLKVSEEQLRKDSILLGVKGISEQEYQRQHSSYLSLQEAHLSLQSSKFMKQSEISRNQLEIQRITLEELENKEKSLAELTIRKNELMNAITVWREHYLQYSPIEGELEYLGFWRNNSFVQTGLELFSIIPEKSTIIGEVLIPSFGAGKVKLKQVANVKINNYPYDEYGLLKGEVKSISRITNKIETKEGTGDAYLVTISFPHGTATNFGRELSLDFETKGQVEIITKRKRLIERLFDNLKSKTEK